MSCSLLPPLLPFRRHLHLALNLGTDTTLCRVHSARYLMSRQVCAGTTSAKTTEPVSRVTRQGWCARCTSPRPLLAHLSSEQ